MTRIGVAGHQDLPVTAIDFITQGIGPSSLSTTTIESRYSSLAAGADQLFAVEVLSRGGQLHAVVPSAGYETTLDGDAADSVHATTRVGVRNHSAGVLGSRRARV